MRPELKIDAGNDLNLDYSFLPDELWSKIFIQALDLHIAKGRVWICDRTRIAPGCGLTHIEKTCRHFRNIVVKNCLWKDACLEYYRALEVVQGANVQELWKGGEVYELLSQGSEEEKELKKKTALFKQLYGLLIGSAFEGTLSKDCLWTSSLTSGYEESGQSYEDNLAHALAHLQDLLSLNFKGDPYSDGRYYSKPQKNPDGVNPNEKVDQLLIQLQYPMVIVKSLMVDLSANNFGDLRRHDDVHVRLYKAKFPGSQRAVRLDVPRASNQESYLKAGKRVQEFLASPIEIVCDDNLDPLAAVSFEPFLCNDGVLLMEFYMTDKQTASRHPAEGFRVRKIEINGSLLPGMRIDEGVLSSSEYDREELAILIKSDLDDDPSDVFVPEPSVDLDPDDPDYDRIEEFMNWEHLNPTDI